MVSKQYYDGSSCGSSHVMYTRCLARRLARSKILMSVNYWYGLNVCCYPVQTHMLSPNAYHGAGRSGIWEVIGSQGQSSTYRV